MKLNTANTLTIIRIAAIPLFVVCFYLPWSWARPAAAGIFIFAALTDLADGYIARRWNQTTAFGAFLDPVADKLIVATALVLLTAADPRLSVAIVAAIIIGREITVSALREWMASVGDRTSVAVSFVGKIKTTMQMIGLSLMIMQYDAPGMDAYTVGYVLLLIAAGLTMWSMWVYMRAAWPALSRSS
ncbi:MAG: CDP-diacylglycerol--glycerol-3-phosphate 3-phosphatidyltransferase [Pseudomonadota bacterium]